MEETFKTLMLNPKDLVAVALEQIPEGATVRVKCDDFSQDICLKETIKFGHKFAVKSIAKGQDIIKYGEVIGKASESIEAGRHVHVHNLEGKRGRGDIIGAN
ncbi:UxaA family hydrolase [Scopulibacillus cellulosilyticus]|uniref:UxaA family hydrolase n=1 Tax=Scopulibacillus cellulosilyticus TaxID=2665665 RepID=A0ABW2PSZ6_9BACL